VLSVGIGALPGVMMAGNRSMSDRKADVQYQSRGGFRVSLLTSSPIVTFTMTMMEIGKGYILPLFPKEVVRRRFHLGGREGSTLEIHWNAGVSVLLLVDCTVIYMALLLLV